MRSVADHTKALKPKAPTMFGACCFVSELRTGAISGLSPNTV